MRRLPILLLGLVVVVAAFSTGLPFLFYIVYLGLLVVGGSYLLTRVGLANLEAGYAVSHLHAHVGDQLRITYTLRNTGRLPKFWLEIRNPSNLPALLPGRALTIGGRAERSWVVRLPLVRRGHFRIDPLQIRTGDPFGFFEASATVGHPVTLIVYPRVDRLPRWRLPAAFLEGSRAAPVRTLQTTPLATAVRPYAPGDSFNRIHWRSTARHGEIQVKEFELEQTADVWIFLDLQRRAQTGTGDASTVEVGVRAAAAIAERALAENRAVGLTTTGHRMAVLPPDRGSRQRLKILQLLAAVEGDGTTSLAEALISGLPRLRRGMTAIVVSPSTDPTWIRPLATLRTRGVGCQLIVLDAHDFAAHTAGLGDRRGAVEPGRARAAAPSRLGPIPSRMPGASAGHAMSSASAGTTIAAAPVEAVALPVHDDGQPMRALVHQIAEYQLRAFVVPSGVALGDVLVG